MTILKRFFQPSTAQSTDMNLGQARCLALRVPTLDL